MVRYVDVGWECDVGRAGQGRAGQGRAGQCRAEVLFSRADGTHMTHSTSSFFHQNKCIVAAAEQTHKDMAQASFTLSAEYMQSIYMHLSFTQFVHSEHM